MAKEIGGMRMLRIAEGDFADEYTCKRTPDVTFATGETQSNHKGEYMVMAILPTSGMMDVEYVGGDHVGETQRLDMEDQGRVIRRMRNERLREQGVRPTLTRGSEEIFSVALLAGCANLHAQVPSDVEIQVARRYQSLAGVDPGGDPNFEVSPEGTNKWHHQLRFRLPVRIGPEVAETLSFGEGIRAIRRRDGAYEVNDTRLAWHLVAIGFRLGHAHDVARIRDAMCQTPSDRERFEEGLAAAGLPHAASLGAGGWMISMS